MEDFIDFETDSIQNKKLAALSQQRKLETPKKYFKSNFIGKRIVYADSGMPTNHIVGSKDEDLYFKVRLSGRIFLPGETDYVNLFYDSPRDYCVHYLTAIDSSARKFRRRETPENFEKRVEKMMSSMAAVIRVWEEKRNIAVRSSESSMDFVSPEDSAGFVEVH